MTDAKGIAANVGQVLRDAILHIDSGGDRGVTTDGWSANWFSVLLAHKRDGRIFTGLSIKENPSGNRVMLTPFGRDVANEIRALAMDDPV